MSLLDLDVLPKALPSDHKRSEIPSGTAGTAATIERMNVLVQHGKRDMRLRPLVSKIIADCKQKDYACYAQAIHDYVCYKIKYAYDPVDVELIEDPYNIVQAGIADCDSKCILFCSLCEQIGLPCRFVTVKQSAFADEFTHVYSEVFVNGKWISSDCTMPSKDFGWQPPEDMPKKRWPISESAAQAGNGFSLFGLGCGCEAKMEDGFTSFMSGLSCGDKPCAKCSANLLGKHKRRKGPNAHANQHAFNHARHVPRGKPKAGVAGLGEDSIGGGIWAGITSAFSSKPANVDQGIVSTLESILDGSYASDLQARKAEAFDIKVAADNAPDSPEATVARQAALAAVRAIQNEISTYSDAVRTIQTYSNGYFKPTQLSSMGLEPVTTVIALAGIGAVTVIIYRLVSAYEASHSTAAYAVEALARAGAQPADVAGVFEGITSATSSAGVTGSIGTAVIIGGLAFLAVKMLQKKGHV